MNKADFRLIEAAWKRFDRLTAWGCAKRNVPFDREKCREAWEAYETLLETYGVQRCPPDRRPIGL